jgi:hypothetical protein
MTTEPEPEPEPDENYSNKGFPSMAVSSAPSEVSEAVTTPEFELVYVPQVQGG